MESETESETDSDRDDLDSISSEESINIEQTEKKNQLLEQKFNLIVRYNANAMDIDEFNKKLKSVNQQLEEINLIDEYTNTDLVNKEYAFIELLDTYSIQIKQGALPGFLSSLQLKKFYDLYIDIKTLIEELVKESINDTEPLESRSLDDVFEDLIKEETKYLSKIVSKVNKQFKIKITLPKRKDYKTEQEFNAAYNDFYKKIGKYVNGEKISQHMNVTSIGSSYDKFEATLKEKFLEIIKHHKELPVRISEKDIEIANKRILLKKLMMKLQESKLIECAMEVESNSVNLKKTDKVELSPSMIILIKKYYKNQKRNNTYGIITNILRNKNIKDFVKEINNISLMKSLENEIYSLTAPDFINYMSKINDILFIFKNYPNFKNFLLESKISITQLVLFEKELAFEALMGITTIKNRRSALKHIKHVLLKQQNYKNKLVNNYKCNVISKRLELLVLDISVNEPNYNKYIDKLINLIKRKSIFEMNNQDIIVYLNSITGKKTKQDYSKFNINEIKALISQTIIDINSLTDKIKLVEQDIKKWNCPRKVLKQEREKWEKTLSAGNLSEIVKFRKFLINKYKLPEDYRLIDLKEKLRIAKKKYNNLNKINLSLQEKEKQKYEGIITISPGTVYTPITFKLDNVMVNELIQLYKRKLMIDSLSISQSDKNKLIDLLELIDINDLIFKNYLLQKKLLIDITKLLPQAYKFFDFNQYYYTASLEAIKPYLDGNIVTFTRNQSGLIDYYGNDIFYKVYNSSSPEVIYKDGIQKEYYLLNESSQVKVEPEYRRLRILYNPYTGKFGKEAYDGYVFEVEKLRKGQDGQPIEDFVMHESIDPRTNEMVYKKIKVPIQGNDPFIKIPILTNKKDQQKFTWISVKKEQTTMLPANYDTCSRFDNNKTSCNSSKGLGNSDCFYDEQSKKCKAGYNTFQKKKVKKKTYNLKMSQQQRRNALIKKIAFDCKKLKIKPTQAAIKAKKRLITLRTRHKNNPKFKKILNNDINFINKKFKI